MKGTLSSAMSWVPSWTTGLRARAGAAPATRKTSSSRAKPIDSERSRARCTAGRFRLAQANRMMGSRTQSPQAATSSMTTTCWSQTGMPLRADGPAVRRVAMLSVSVTRSSATTAAWVVGRSGMKVPRKRSRA